MTTQKQGHSAKRDWRVSATLLAVWTIAISVVTFCGSDIPVSMLVIATVFFVLLIPSMNDLVGNIEKFFNSVVKGSDQTGR